VTSSWSVFIQKETNFGQHGRFATYAIAQQYSPATALSHPQTKRRHTKKESQLLKFLFSKNVT
jgi:hypothetical protein